MSAWGYKQSWVLSWYNKWRLFLDLLGSTDSFCHRKSNPSPRGGEAQHRYLPAYLVVMCGLQAPSASSWQGAGLRAPWGWLPAFLQLFILSTHCFVNTREVGVSPPQPPTTAPFLSQGLRVKEEKKKKQLTSKGNPEKLKCGSIHCDGTRSRQKQVINSLRSSIMSHNLSHPHQALGEAARDWPED